MKRLGIILFSLLPLLTVLSCGKEKINSSSDKFYVMADDPQVNGKMVTLCGRVGSSLDLSEVTEVGFYYTDGSSVPEDGSASWVPAAFSDEKHFSAAFSVSAYGKSYKWKAAAKTGSKTHYSKERGFKTDPLHVSSVSINPTLIPLEVDQSKEITVTVLPADASDKSFTWKIADPTVASASEGTLDNLVKITAKKAGETTLTITTTDSKKTAEATIKVRNARPDGAVDMGTSVYWAVDDLYDRDSYAATKYYFAWGEIKSKSSYTKENYVFYYNNKVNYTDGLQNGVLMYTRDAARAIKGGNWRMPTNAEYLELKNACNIVEKYENRRYVTVFTSKTTGKSITLYRDAGCYVGSDNVETDILNLNYLHADLGSDGKPDTFGGGNPEYYGFRIRPVSD